jgi:hypothetical protein
MSSQEQKTGAGQDGGDSPFDFDRVIADIRRATEILARPEAKEWEFSYYPPSLGHSGCCLRFARKIYRRV